MLVLCFLGGAGGNFVSNMLSMLQDSTQQLHTDTHFHQSIRSIDIRLTHDEEDKCRYFCGDYKFNMYLNAVIKYNITDRKQHTQQVSKQLELFNQVAYSSIIFQKDALHINYDDLYIDPEKFIEDCFKMFDEAKIDYTKDYEIAARCVENFKTTCIDPRIYFGDINSNIWLGWCLGIDRLFLNECPIFENKALAQEHVSHKQDLYKDITQQYNMVYFDV